METYLISQLILSFGKSFLWGPGIVILVLLFIFEIYVFWQVFEKAGEPGWAVLVPFYNLFVLIRMAGKEWWWFFLLFIPIIQVVVAFIIFVSIAENFKKPMWFGIAWVILPLTCSSIVAFDDSTFGDEPLKRGQPPVAKRPMICPTCNVLMNKVSAHEADPLFICPQCNKQQIRMFEK